MDLADGIMPGQVPAVSGSEFHSSIHAFRLPCSSTSFFYSEPFA